LADVEDDDLAALQRAVVEWFEHPSARRAQLGVSHLRNLLSARVQTDLMMWAKGVGFVADTDIICIRLEPERSANVSLKVVPKTEQAITVVVETVRSTLRRLDELLERPEAAELRAQCHQLIAQAESWRDERPSVEARDALVADVLALHRNVLRISNAK